MNLNVEKHTGLWLTFFRISLPTLCLIELLSYWSDFKIFYSSNGIIKSDIINSTTDTVSFSLYDLQQFIDSKININIDYNLFVQYTRSIYCIALFFIAIGLLTKINTLFCIFLQLLISKSFPEIQYGFDYFTTLCFFYILIFPTNKYFSLDKKFRFKQYYLFDDKYALLIIKIHVCIMYFFAGFDKLIGYNWRNGESMWRVLTEYNNTNLYDFKRLYNTPFFYISGWVTIIFEMLYPIFINIKKTRLFWLISIILLHLFIALILGLSYFSLIMIILNLTAYYYPSIQFKNEKSK